MGVAAAEKSALEARIVESYRRTRSTVKTAAELNTNESRVYRVLKAHGVEMNPKGWNEKSATTDRAAVIRFYEQCRNQSQTAAQFGISRAFVRSILRENKVEFHSRVPRREISAEKVLAAYEKTRSQPKTAAALGVSLATVQRRLDSLAVERTDHRHWREDELARLEQGYASARNCGRLEEFADELGRPLSTVMVKAAERGLTDPSAPRLWLRTWSAMSDEELREMLARFVESGLCVADFAEREGVTADSFARTMRERFRDEWEAAVASRTAPWVSMSLPDLRDLLARFSDSGLTVGQFAAREGVSKESFARAMRERLPGEWENALVKSARASGTSFGVGINVEFEVVRVLRRHEFDCYVSPGSRSPVDVFAIGPDGSAYGVQAKRGGPGRLTPAEWNTLLDHCEKTGATPLLACDPSGRGLELWRLTGKKDASTVRRQPCERVWLTETGTLTDASPAAAAA